MKYGLLGYASAFQFCFALLVLGAEPAAAVEPQSKTARQSAQLQTRNTGPSNTPVSAVPDVIENEYRLGPSDLIEVFVWKEPDLTMSVAVRPDGKVSLPLTGEIEAGGRTAAEMQKEITGRLRQYLTNPVVNVIVKEVNSPKISVLGQVKNPGVYQTRHRITVFDAIAMAGGFTEFAKRDRVIVIRNGPAGQSHTRLNVERLLKDGKGPPIYLESLDTIYVE